MFDGLPIDRPIHNVEHTVSRSSGPGGEKEHSYVENNHKWSSSFKHHNDDDVTNRLGGPEKN